MSGRRLWAYLVRAFPRLVDMLDDLAREGEPIPEDIEKELRHSLRRIEELLEKQRERRVQG